jgi:RimJ/RimL family protein N-acetyltransferase
MTISHRPQFASEPITPVPGAADPTAMSHGEPSVPTAFVWREQRFDVARVLSTRRAMGQDRGDTYLRRHYYDIETADGVRMTLYFERNPSDRSKRKRWWLYTYSTPEPVIETPRLTLRRWTYADRDAFRAMVSNPDTMRHLHDSVPLTPAQADDALFDTIERYNDGFGDWAIVRREDGLILGESGLTRLPELDAIEIGYMLEPMHWGQGYATEAATAVMRYAFDQLKLDRLVALTRPENERSIRVLEKLGMHREGRVMHRGHDMVKYARAQERGTASPGTASRGTASRGTASPGTAS